MSKKNLKIGKEFEYEGKKFKVTEWGFDTCTKCYFRWLRCWEKKLPACTDRDRKDNKNVIFTEVK